MVKELYGLGLRREDVEELLRLVDWFLALPEELETRFEAEIRAWKEAEKMPYVTSFERMGIKQGRLEEGIRALFLVGITRLGEPDDAARRRIESETELEQIETWLRNLTQTESWAELLDIPA
jgi:hypothetical protein